MREGRKCGRRPAGRPLLYDVPMTQVGSRFSSADTARLDAYAARHGVARGEAVRHLVVWALDVEERERATQENVA